MTRGAPQWLRAVSGPNGLSLPAWLLLGLPTVVGGGAILAGGMGQSQGEGLAWGLLSWIALGAVWWIARMTWMSGTSQRRRQWLIIPTYALAAAARTLMLSFSGPSVDIRGGVVVSIFNVTLLSLLLSVLVDRLRTLDLAAGRLEVVRAGLIDAGARAAEETARLRSYTRETILAGVRQALSQAGDPDSVAQGLRDVSAQLVRPMSHELADRDVADASLQAEQAAFIRPRRDISSVARATLDAGPIRPLTVLVLYAAFALPLCYYVFGWPRMVGVVVVTVACTALLLGLARIVPWRRLPTAWGIALLFGALVGAGAAGVLALRLGPVPQGLVGGAAIYGSTFLTLVGGSIAVLRGLAYRQSQIEESLVEAARALAEVVLVERAELRRSRSHLARVLHGVVQPRLVARALQVQRADMPLDIAALEAEVISLLSDRGNEADTVEASRALRDLAEIWADSVDVRVDVPEAIASVLGAQPATAMAVANVAREAVNNAVLRGGATWVDLSLRGDGRRVTITVVNREAAAGVTLDSPGYGSRIYDDLTDSWSLESVDGRVVFTAIVGIPERREPGSLPQESPSGVIAD